MISISKLFWSNHSVAFISSDNGIEYDFFDTLTENHLYQHVNIPTFQLSNEKCENTMNLVFTTTSGSFSKLVSKFVLANLKRGNLILCFDLILNETVNINNEG